MNIKLFKYNKKSNVANKMVGLSPVFAGDITPYGSFSTKAVVFKLNELYDVNLCEFEFNRHKYYGNVTVDVDTNGIYVYSVKTDALTTAWYNGCMDTGATCLYSSYGSNKIYDARIPTYDYNNRFEFQVSQTYITQYMYIVVVRTNNSSGTLGLPIISNPYFEIYAFTANAFDNFYEGLRLISASDQTKFVPSIVGIYIIPESWLNIYTSTSETVTSVSLYATLGDNEGIQKSVSNNFSAIKIDNVYFGTLRPIYSGGDSITLNFPLTSTRQYAIFDLHVKDCGNFVFKYSDVSKNENISEIGYATSFDFVSGRITVFLKINGKILPEYRIDTNIAYSFPVAYDSSIDRWDRLNASIAGSILGTAGTVAAVAAGSLSYGAGFIAAAGIAVGAGANIYDFQHQKEYGSIGLVGGNGTSSESMADIGSKLTIKYQEQIGLTDFQNLYGKPDYTTRNLQNARAGYYQTIKCKLLGGGIDVDIIKEAEALCDSGFYII